MVGAAIRRTRPMLARYDVSPHMVKWWKSQLKDNGQVRCPPGDQRKRRRRRKSGWSDLSLIGVSP